ncbi:hypothetical protein LWC35_18165 [Pseudonocardia kujensis]|uniref:hypothetical protein n=1 Tax=Pseudonocardia kujensis TaxID=1128675 RepID=UPI001E541E4B|nr:hypothetical protein [Pseudonocardia kujensis]MCE0764816.1 hypothetical protein [Pseudonocardia kujensis]
MTIVPMLGFVAAFGLLAIIAGILRKLMEINFVAWSLRRQGVSDEEIQKFALATAKRERANLLVVVLGKVLDCIKSWKL